jgi:YHS domain-containing protein
MRTYSTRLAIAVAAFVIPSLAWAQHGAHQPGAGQGPSAELTQCLRVQPVIENIITAATNRAEAARLSNSPTAMRAAVESLEAALRDIRAQSAPCSEAAAATDPQAGHTMPDMQQPAGAHTPAAPMDRSTMPMGSGATAKKPGAAPGTKPATPAAPMDHSKMRMGEATPETVMDPVNGLRVDPATAPKATYQGQTYYFSSEQSRKEFLENPAKFAKKPKG